MQIKLFVFGKLKTPGLREAADHYLRQLRPWVRVEETELKPLPVPEKSEALRRQIQQKEADALLKAIAASTSGRGPVYALDETGKAQSTREWAEWVRGWEREGAPDVAFCLGSSLGFGEQILARAKGVLSLGPHTMAHELARLVLLEQLYRAWSVTRGHPYHNAD